MTYGFMLLILSSFYNLFGTLFFVIGTVFLTDKNIDKLSETVYDQNLVIKKAFLKQRLDYSFGFVFLLISSIIQIINASLGNNANNKATIFIHYLFYLLIPLTMIVSLLLRKKFVLK